MIATPTPTLRLLRMRYDPGAVRLQQQFVVTTDADYVEVTHEWRDVPIVDEETKVPGTLDEVTELRDLVNELDKPRKQRERVISWHVGNGGRRGRLAGHALRLLTEAVELCAAAGASLVDISMHVDAQLEVEGKRNVALQRPVDIAAMRQELADVSMCLDIVDYWSGDKPDQLYADREAKLKINHDRKWEADQDGVLWRPKEGT